MKNKKGKQPGGSVKLISGKWGGRVPYFPAIDGLRPTLGESARNTIQLVTANYKEQ